MSQQKDYDELAQIFWNLIQESTEVRAKVDKLTGLVAELRQIMVDDAAASQYVEEMRRALGTFDSLLKELSAHIRTLKSRTAASASQSSVADAAQAKKKILVIDDERSVLNLVERVLKSRGYEVDTASGGLKGIGKLEAQFYDLVIVDLKMPEIAGGDVYQHIEDQNPEQARHVVFFSGDVVSPDTTEFLKRSGRPFLVKPFTIQELVDFVEQAFASIRHSSGPAAR